MAGQRNGNNLSQRRSNVQRHDGVVSSLWLHNFFYYPFIAMCMAAYFEPIMQDTSELVAACNREYKDLSLYCGLSLILPSLFIVYIQAKNQTHSHDTTEILSFVALGLEFVLCIVHLVYYQNLRFSLNKVCQDTGTSLGEIVILIIEGLTTAGIIIAFFMIGALIVATLMIIGKRICCSWCGGKVVVGSSLAKIPYMEHYFTSCTDSCAICLSEFQYGETVSPLYCNIKHVFHTECVRMWLVSNPVCPLCKATICPQKL